MASLPRAFWTRATGPKRCDRSSSSGSSRSGSRKRPTGLSERNRRFLARRKPAATAGGAASAGADGARDRNPLASLKSSLGVKQKISARVLENFTRLLSSLLAAGVPFSRALIILYREATVPVAKAKWKEIHDLVIDGMSLSDAMARSPETFPRVYVAMVEAGETGGFLDVVLAQIADFQAREKDIKSKVVSALTYPLILLVLAVGVLIFLMVFFIPRFQLIFKSFNADLPLLTQLIVQTSQAVRDYGLYVGGRPWWPSFPCAAGSNPRAGTGLGKGWSCACPWWARCWRSSRWPASPACSARCSAPACP